MEFLEKEKEEVREDQLKRSIEILSRTAVKQKTPQDDQDVKNLSNCTLTRDKNRREIRCPSRYAQNNCDELKSYEEAMNSIDSSK